MSNYIINESEKITKELLNSYYSKMDLGQELLIYKSGKKIDQSKEGLLLIKCGFEKIVQMRECPRKGCILIKCIKAEKREPKLSVIVPMYEEGRTADELLKQLISHKWIMDTEIIIVESNSKDGTREIAKKHAEENPGFVKIILEDGPTGKGNAVLKGLKQAEGNYYAIQDGDLEYKIEDYDRLLVPLVNQEALFVLGSRYRKDDWKMRKFSEGGSKNNLIAGYLNFGQKLLTPALNN